MQVDSGIYNDREEWRHDCENSLHDYYIVFALMPFKHLNLVMYYNDIEHTIKSFQGWASSTPLIRFYKDSMTKKSLKENKYIYGDGPNRNRDLVIRRDVYSKTHSCYSFFLHLFSRPIEMLFAFGLFLTCLKCIQLRLFASSITTIISFGFFIFHLYNEYIKKPDFTLITEFLPRSFVNKTFITNFVRKEEEFFKNPIVKTVKSFLTRELKNAQDSVIAPKKYVNENLTMSQDKELNEQNLFCSQNTNRPKLCVSISGGVDSMVLTYVFAMLRNVFNYDLEVLHINYKNRKESDAEEAFVRWYCDKMNVPITVRRITEIQRRSLGFNRTFYEDLTRKIRFDLYFLTNAKIVLGHTHDDVLENIWTNFAKSQHIFNLPKMTSVATESMKVLNGSVDVELWRPLLHTKKDVIINFAKEFGIAYLLNTTPEWSNRGKFRNKFLPAIHEQYTEAADVNVEFVAESLREYAPIIEKVVNDLFNSQTLFAFQQGSYKSDDCYIPSDGYLGRVLILDEQSFNYGVHFWQHYFKKLSFDMFGRKDVPSRKTLLFFLDRIRHLMNVKKSGAIQMESNIYVYFKFSKLSPKIYFLDREIVSKKLNISKLDLGTRHFNRLFPPKVYNKSHTHSTQDKVQNVIIM